MALKTFVKVGNISNLSDARYCAGMGVDQLGFNTDSGSDEMMDLDTIQSIREWVSGVEIIAEEGIPEDMELFDGIQFTIDHLVHATPGIPLIVSMSLVELRKLPALPEETSYILLTGEGDKIERSVLDEIRSLKSHHKIVLEYGFNKDNVLEVIDHPAVSGIAMKGSEEIRPGFKDYNELMDILEILEDDPWD